MFRSCHYNGENINWVNLKSQIFQKKQRQWKQAKQPKEWCHCPSYMNIETWKIYLPVIILSDDIQGCCIGKYIRCQKTGATRGTKDVLGFTKLTSHLVNITWLKSLCLFWNSKDLYKTTHFCFWYQTETFKHHEKWKVSSSSLKFKFPCMNFFQLSHFKVDSKICRTPRENWCRRWHHCCDNFEWNWYNDRSSVLRSRTFVMGWLQRITPVFKTKHLRQMLICRLDKGCQWLDPNVMAGKVFLNF